jgi:hypothetical protein
MPSQSTFKCNPKGLYTYEVSDEYLTKQRHMINIVKENRVGYTQRQFDQAKGLRELYHIVGTPTIKLFKNFIKMKAIKNCPVTKEDVNNAKKIWLQTCPASRENRNVTSLPQ